MNQVSNVSENNNSSFNYQNALEYGREYVEVGFTTIPLDRNAQPLLSDWERYKHTTTRATIEDAQQWAKQWPDLKWGLATGRGVGFIVVHVKPDGDKSKWPDTICYEAEDGGINLIYAHPGNYYPKSVKVKSIENFLPNTDSIGDDSYVALPSCIRDGGWIMSIDDIDVAKIPEELLPLLLDDPDYILTSVPEGIATPEEERYNLATQYLSELLAGIDVSTSDRQLIESLWPRVQLWNSITSKRPYRNEKELRYMFDLFIDPVYSPLLVSASDEVLQTEDDQTGTGGRTPSQSTRLVNIVSDNPEIVLFRDEYGVAHVQFPVGDHKEVWPCSSSSFIRWLGNEYYRLTKGRVVASREAVKDAISLLEGRAINECPEHRLFNRVAQTPDAIWYDLGDDQFRAVKITEDGWEIVTDVPILFRRFSHLAPQVAPMRGGSVDEILKFVNVTGVDNQILFLVHLVSTFIPDWPHPVSYVYGGQGSAKSTLSRIMRKLIDPSKIEILSLTRNEGDLIQQLGHHYYVSYDNVSDMPNWVADLLCRAVTGGGFSKRELYTNDSDIIRYVLSNIGINGIDIASNRPDLLERSLLIRLERMNKSERRQEYDLMAEFENARSRILGAIFDTVAKAMTLRPHIKVSELPRMADFALWGCAISEALGIGQTAFLSAYFRNVNSQSETLINDNTVATIIVAIVDAHNGRWESSPTMLFKAFKDKALADQIVDNRLPATPSALMREINRLKTPLEELGYKITSSSTDRTVTIININTWEVDIPQAQA